MNIEYMASVIPQLGIALWLTVKISFVGIFLSLLIGAIISFVIFYKTPFLYRLANGYVAFFRNTPLLLQLFFLYFGLPRAFGILLSFETTALIGLSLLGGAYMAESFKAAIKSIATSQFESGKAIGLNRWQMIWYILLPQAISYSVPTLGANCIFLFKETSVFTAIAGTDITTKAINLISSYGYTNENLILLVLAYISVILPFTFLLTYIEKKVRYAEFGA